MTGSGWRPVHTPAAAVCVSSELPVWQHGESATPGARANLGTGAFPSEPASGPVARFVALAMREVRRRIAETWERIISSLRCGMPFLGIPLQARGHRGDKFGLYVPLREVRPQQSPRAGDTAACGAMHRHVLVPPNSDPNVKAQMSREEGSSSRRGSVWQHILTTPMPCPSPFPVTQGGHHPCVLLRPTARCSERGRGRGGRALCCREGNSLQ